MTLHPRDLETIVVALDFAAIWLSNDGRAFTDAELLAEVANWTPDLHAEDLAIVLPLYRKQLRPLGLRSPA